MGMEGVAGSHRSLFPSSTQNSFVTTPLVKKIKKDSSTISSKLHVFINGVLMLSVTSTMAPLQSNVP